MKIKRGEDPGLVAVKGYSGIVLEVVEFQPDLSDYSDSNDLWNWYSHHPWNRRNSVAAICKVVAGDPPASWETCTPYGHYRVNVKNLRKASTLEALAAV